MNSVTRRQLLATSAAAAGLAMAGPAAAQGAYPNQAIKIIVPFAAGGGGDALARILAEKLNKPLGQQIVVDNRPGAGTIPGTEAGVRAAPDGYTLLLQVQNLVMLPFVSTVNFNPLTDLIPVVEIVRAQSWLAVNTQRSNARTAREFVAQAKANPNDAFYGTIGPGSSGHLMGYHFAEQTGLNWQHVPYKGGGPASQALVAGEIPAAFIDLIVLKPHVESGKVRLIGVSGTARSTVYPDVPTFAEQGIDGFTILAWAGLFAPKGTPQPIVDKIALETNKVLSDPDIIEKFRNIGYDAGKLVKNEFASMVGADSVRWEGLIKKVGVKLE